MGWGGDSLWKGVGKVWGRCGEGVGKGWGSRHGAGLKRERSKEPPVPLLYGCVTAQRHSHSLCLPRESPLKVVQGSTNVLHSPSNFQTAHWPGATKKMCRFRPSHNTHRNTHTVTPHRNTRP
jgi:hypothetical protein